MTKYEELPLTAAGPFRIFTGFPIKSPMRRHSLALLIYYAYDFNFKACKNQYLLMQSTVYYNNLYRFYLMFKAWVILNEKDAGFKRQKFLKTIPLGEAMSKRGCKKEGLMQYKCMERQIRKLHGRILFPICHVYRDNSGRNAALTERNQESLYTGS